MGAQPKASQVRGPGSDIYKMGPIRTHPRIRHIPSGPVGPMASQVRGPGSDISHRGPLQGRSFPEGNPDRKVFCIVVSMSSWPNASWIFGSHCPPREKTIETNLEWLAAWSQ